MPTGRRQPAVVSTPTHLVVAGGEKRHTDGFSSEDLNKWVEVLDTKLPQWSVAKSLPQPSTHPQMTLCRGCFYLSSNKGTVFSCSEKELLESCKSSDCGSVWTRLADHPIQHLGMLKDHVVATGDLESEHQTAGVYRYVSDTNAWKVIGRLPTPLSSFLTAVLTSANKVIVVGGIRDDKESFDTYIGFI